LQFDEHPIPSEGLLSSHTSGGRQILFPHISHYEPSGVQYEFASILHVELQPSPFKVLLSSHVSDEDFMPSPQIQWQTEGSAYVQIKPNSI